ncbi:hypothetical protein R6Q59_032767 [Mikania micrantha]
MLGEGFYDVDEGDYHTIGIIIAACFVLVALLLSSLTILQHLKFYTNPEEQKWIVAVLFMVPVYATESILSLWKPVFALVCDILRSCYEAFALYSFGSYLIACLGGERRVVELLENEKETLLKKPLLDGKDLKPDLNRTSLCKFFRQPRILGEELLQIEKFGLVQYMILKTFCSFLAMVLELLGVYGDGEFKWYYGYMAVAAVAHVFVFSAKPYHFLPVSEYGKISTKTIKEAVKVEEGDVEKPALIEKTETMVEAPGTSVKESMQEIVVEGGQHVVDDVKLTINQAIEPVGKGVTKIQETFHHLSVGDHDKKSELEVDECGTGHSTTKLGQCNRTLVVDSRTSLNAAHTTAFAKHV